VVLVKVGMAVEAFGISIALLGAAALVGGIAGGLKFGGTEIPVLKSPARCWTLAIVGVVFLLTGFAVIGQAHTTPPNPPNSFPAPSTTVAEPDNQDYVTQANAVCRQANNRIAGLAPPAPNDSDTRWIDYTSSYAGILYDMADDLDRLEPPATISVTHGSLVFYIRQYADSLDRAAVALGAGDQTGWNQHVNNADGYKARYSQLARQLSLANCEPA
jgi:hypothetical protein